MIFPKNGNRAAPEKVQNSRYIMILLECSRKRIPALLKHQEDATLCMKLSREQIDG